MGQYFAAVNTDKKEFVCPWCIGGSAKLWEWSANPWGAIFTLLLRQSTRSGGGDYYGHDSQIMSFKDDMTGNELARAVAKAVASEGQPVHALADFPVGRWAGDRIALVGDYDDSGIWDELFRSRTYRNISADLVPVWNEFIDIEQMQLKYEPCSTCGERAECT